MIGKDVTPVGRPAGDDGGSRLIGDGAHLTELRRRKTGDDAVGIGHGQVDGVGVAVGVGGGLDGLPASIGDGGSLGE